MKCFVSFVLWVIIWMYRFNACLLLVWCLFMILRWFFWRWVRKFWVFVKVGCWIMRLNCGLMLWSCKIVGVIIILIGFLFFKVSTIICWVLGMIVIMMGLVKSLLCSKVVCFMFNWFRLSMIFRNLVMVLWFEFYFICGLLVWRTCLTCIWRKKRWSWFFCCILLRKRLWLSSWFCFSWTIWICKLS